MVDLIVPRAELRATLGRILGLLRSAHPAEASQSLTGDAS
jgi:hypothetical protein